MRFKSPLNILVAACVLSSAAVQSANMDDVIEHRHGVMGAIGGHFASIRATLRGPENLQENFSFHADAIARLANIAVDLFPEGSDKGKTDASPEIWEKPEEFEKAMQKLLDRSDDLKNAVGNGSIPAIANAAKELGGACKGCHKKFKED